MGLGRWFGVVHHSEIDTLAAEFAAASLERQIDIGACVRAMLRRCEELDREISNALKDSGALEIGRFVFGQSFEVRLNTAERRGIDAQALRNDNPGLAERYSTCTQYETLTYRTR